MLGRGSVLVAAIALFAAVPSVAQEAGKGGASLDYLAKWEGHYPTTTRSLMDIPPGKTFWDDPNVLAAMKKNIPVDLMRKIILGWDMKGNIVEKPIQKRKDVLFVSVCQPHECASNAARLYFNLKRGTVQLCWTETNPQNGRQLDIWIAKNVKRLGSDACSRNDDFKGLAVYGDSAY